MTTGGEGRGHRGGTLNTVNPGKGKEKGPSIAVSSQCSFVRGGVAHNIARPLSLSPQAGEANTHRHFHPSSFEGGRRATQGSLGRTCRPCILPTRRGSTRSWFLCWSLARYYIRHSCIRGPLMHLTYKNTAREGMGKWANVCKTPVRPAIGGDRIHSRFTTPHSRAVSVLYTTHACPRHRPLPCRVYTPPPQLPPPTTLPRMQPAEPGATLHIRRYSG